MARMTVERIYDCAPVWVQQGMTSLSGMRKARTRYGAAYREEVSFLRYFDELPLAEKYRIQNCRLTEFLRFAREASRYYARVLDGLLPEGTVDESFLQELPLLEKESVRQESDEIYTVVAADAVIANTGGTTGKSLTVRFTPVDMMRRIAMLDHFKYRTSGFVSRKMKRASFGGSRIIPPKQSGGPYWRYNAAARQLLFSPYHITEKSAGDYIDRLNQFQPAILDGYYSSILDLASYLLRNPNRRSFKLSAVYPTSETLTAEGREMLTQAFDCPVYDQYASSEGAPFFTECVEGTLHVEMGTGIFESVGSNHEAVVTSFSTRGTPLIRYRVGDVIELGDDIDCRCGISSKTVKSIQGRVNEYLVRADGAHIAAPNIANLVKRLPRSVIKSQVVQRVPGEITIRLQVDEHLHKEDSLETLRSDFHHVFGADATVNIEYVQEIPKEPNGKYRFIKNEVGKAT